MDQARPTLRQTTESESRTGNVVQNGESKGSYVSDGVDALNTIREEMTEKQELVILDSGNQLVAAFPME